MCVCGKLRALEIIRHYINAKHDRFVILLLCKLKDLNIYGTLSDFFFFFFFFLL